ncbi:MAG: sigma-70 family RNA polymerase sigma factor [Novosphingobium sp.]|nr:sigma-70 family RNA polymerase sigma factor [Novosphingobium sp.]
MKHRPDRLDALIADARAGDRAAYRAFLAEAAKRLRGFIARRAGAPCEVEDIVQECLIALHEKRATLDPARPVGPWMYAIARYKLADHRRRRRRFPEASGELPEIAVAADELAASDVAVLLDRLPAAQAQAIRLTRIEGLTGREASERVGVRLSAMKLRVHRGIASLRKLVDADR